MSNICGGNKYEIAGIKEETIALSVSFKNLPKEIEAEEHTLYLQNSFHISLFYLGRIIKKYTW